MPTSAKTHRHNCGGKKLKITIHELIHRFEERRQCIVVCPDRDGCHSPAGFSITNRNGKTHFPSACLLEDEIEVHSIGEATVAMAEV
jgi:hypothetical protein